MAAMAAGASGGVAAALALSCMVTASGPDPRLIKARRRPFYAAHDGVTSFSTTGIVMPPAPKACTLAVTHTGRAPAGSAGVLRATPLPLSEMGKGQTGADVHVLVPASAVSPFLRESAGRAELLPGTRLEVALGPMGVGAKHSAPRPCTLLGIVEAPPVGRTVRRLVDSRAASGNPWVVGWSAAANAQGDPARNATPPSAPPPATLQDVLDAHAKLYLKAPTSRPPANESVPERGNARRVYEEEGANPRSVGRFAILLVAPPPAPASAAGPQAAPATAEMEATADPALSRRRAAAARAESIDLDSAARSANSLAHTAAQPVGAEEDAARLALAARAWRQGLTSATWTAGTRVHAAGSPFGTVSPMHFAHGVVSGAISAAYGEAESVLLVDARALPGMEGAPLCDESGALLGMLVPPLRLRDGSAEIPLAARSGSLRNALAAVLAPLEAEEKHDDGDGDGVLASGVELRRVSAPVVKAASAAVVLCQSASGGWASGVSVGPGIVLTVSHLFPPAAPDASGELPTAAVRYGDGTWARARAMYVAGYPFNGGREDADDSLPPLDVAVLVLEDTPPPPARTTLAPCTEHVGPGTPVAVVGHPLFGPSVQLAPTVSMGVITRTIPMDDDDSAAMLQTSAAVHAGSSGGAVVDAQGRLVALMTSNATHTRGGTLPHLNFAIPVASLLLPAWRAAVAHRKGDVRQRTAQLAQLAGHGPAESRVKAARRIWASLQPGQKAPPAGGDPTGGAPGGAKFRAFLNRSRL